MSKIPLTDERMGLPSASSALYDSLCHRRWRSQVEWDQARAAMGGEPSEPPEEVGADTELDEEGEDSVHDDIDRDQEAGKRIHLLYSGKPCPEASNEERDRAAAGREVDQAMYHKWLDILGHKDDSPVIELRETRW